MGPDELCEKYFEKKVQVSITCDDGMVFVRGDKKALRFLGELFIAQSEFKKDDGFQISPKGGGSGLFNKKSKYGLYIKRDD